MRHRQTSRGLVGLVERHRVAVTFLTLFLMASPGRPDDRRLLQANAGAKTDVLVILDSSTSMNNEFADSYRLPAYMDDFMYPQGTFATEGSKMGVAKSVLREVLTATEGVNWAFTYYRNPNQTYGAQTMEIGTSPTYSRQALPVGGARTAGQTLQNGGLEWLYFADKCLSGCGAGWPFASTEYPDLQQGRFLQLGHKVPRYYGKPGFPTYPPFTVPPQVADVRPPYLPPAGVPTAGEPFPGEFRGAFGPHGLNEGKVIYRNGTQKPGFELRMQIVNGHYGDPSIELEIQEWGAPPTPTATPTNTFTPSNTPTSTPSSTNTPTATRTASNTPTATATQTATNTPTNTGTFTPSSTRTSTFTPSITNTSTQTSTRTQTFTPSNTPTASSTRTPTGTRTPTNTPSRTRTPTVTNTASSTSTPSVTFTRSNTPTSSNTPTRSNTPSATNTQTATSTATITNTASNTPTSSRTSTPTATRTSSNTPTNTNTASRTPTSSNTPTFTASNTRTFTPSNTATFTPSPTPTNTPPPAPTFSGGAVPGASLLPMMARWIAPAVRGLFAMAPPPPPPPPAPTCPGIPALYGPPQCAPCPDASAGGYWDPSKTCAFVDSDGDGVITAADSPPSLQVAGVPGTLPSGMRGFDDPQYDPDPTLIPVRTVRIQLARGDLYDLPPAYTFGDLVNGNPPWGSQAGDVDADGVNDGSVLPNRHNQGMYSAFVDNGPAVILENQQIPGDSFGQPSCPVDATRFDGSGNVVRPCDPYSEDCGGFARYDAAAPTGFDPYPAGLDPPSQPDWPVVPFQREWIGSDRANVDVIKRLLRFTTSIVSYDSSAPASSAYRLEEAAVNVVTMAIKTPVSGALLDAYNYLTKSVFPDAVANNDPAINCRNYIIVYITDGIDECAADSCSGGLTGLGPSGDLGQVALPDVPSGSRALANGFDPSVHIKGVPVFMVALMDPSDSRFPKLQCIADNSGGDVFSATDRDELRDKLRSILDLKRTANFFAAPSVPAFASGFGDSAQIGAVIPSHENVNGDLSTWSIWSGSLKSYKLSAQGLIPAVTAAAPTATASPTPGGPTATPVVATPTPTPLGSPVNSYPDETDPNNANASLRKPIWNAARVLGYTDPVADLAESAASISAAPALRAPAINVWPGRKMIFARFAAGVPLARADFMPNSGGCTGFAATDCFGDLMTNMGLTLLADPATQTKAILTVQFLRGGQTAYGTRDEILNDASIRPATVPTIGPGGGQEQKYSYFYQDDAPAPGDPPQVRTDGQPAAAPAGYAHKLGDIFHSEPLMLEPPRYFQYISANLAPRTSSSTFGEPYIDFATRQGKRRKVVFVGSNDGFFHSFDAGVWNRDLANFPSTHDLGTGREIFAYAPRSIMNGKFPNLLNFPPTPQYFVDGSMAAADVFMDPSFNAVPDETERVWRTVLVGTMRQGGSTVFALDVTQPDDIDTTVGSPTFGEIVGNKDASPGCLDGGGGSCVAGATPRPYPEILWELTDAGVACSDGCTLAAPAMGETWSRPVVGRIKVYHPASPTADPSGFDSRFVAIFGGGYSSGFLPGDDPSISLPRGRALYVVDVETGKILFKTSEGVDGGGATRNFAPMPAAPAVADYNDDGYLDVAYIGDMNGQMWRIDLTPDAASIPKRGEFVGTQLHGYKPFLIFDGCESAGACVPKQPVFYEPGIVFLGGAATPPVLGIAFGTGDRSDLTVQSTAPNSFFYVVDSGQTIQTFVKADLRNLTPGQAGPCPTPYNPATCANASNGFVLDFSSNNEKATSTVYSTQGYLSIITFTPDSANPCATNGSSYRYRFFFLTGQGGYGSGSTYPSFQESLGSGLAAASQSTSPQGDIIDTVLFSGGSIQEDVTPGTLRTIEQNWKEQQ